MSSNPGHFPGSTERPSLGSARRFVVALAIGVLYFLITYGVNGLSDPTKGAGDFQWPLLAARAVLRGFDPYSAVVVSGRHEFFYPYPAAFVAMPFTWLPDRLAGELVVGLGATWLAYLLARDAWWPLLIFASAPMLQATVSVQWTPLLVAASFTPLLGILVAKPSVALPLLAGLKRWHHLIVAILGGATLLGIAFIHDPGWLVHWYQTVHNAPASAQYRPAAFTLLGAPLLIAAFGWRSWRARIVFAMALAPANAFFYDQLPLMLVPQNRKRLLFLVLTSNVAFLWPHFVTIDRHGAGKVSAGLLPFVLAGLYYPALWFALRPADE